MPSVPKWWSQEKHWSACRHLAGWPHAATHPLRHVSPPAASGHGGSSATMGAIAWLINLFWSVTGGRLDWVIFPMNSLNTVHLQKQLHKTKRRPSNTFRLWKCISCEKRRMLQRHMTSEKIIIDFFGSVWPWNKIAPYSIDRIALRASLQFSLLLVLGDTMWFSETLAAVLMEKLNEWTEMTTLIQMHLSESSAILR